MKKCVEKLAPLLEMDAPNLAQWLLECLQTGKCGPLSQISADYDSAADYLIDCLHEQNEETLSIRFGDAACLAFKSLFTAGEFSSREASKSKENVLTNILFLLEALPCSHNNAEDFVQRSLILLAGHAESVIGGEKNLRARIFLSLASKLPKVRGVDPEIARVFKKDLSDPDYCIAAYAVVLRLNPALAAEEFSTVLQSLPSNGFLHKTLIFEVARVLAKNPENWSVLVNPIHDAGQEVRREFRDALARVKQQGLLEKWDTLVATPSELTRSDADGPAIAEAQPTNPMLSWQSPQYFEALTRAIRSFPEGPLAVGKAVGKMVAVVRWASQRPNGGFSANDVPIAELGKLVKYLDNGLWQDGSLLRDNLAAPAWFTAQNRRLVAAVAVRQCVQEVASSWKTDTNRLSEAISQTTIRNWLDELSRLMLGTETKVIRVGVTPFPEDRLFYVVLKEAARDRENISFEAVESIYGQPTSGGRQPDCYLVNEWADIPQLRRTKPSDNIYKHKGYFVFGTGPVPESSHERFKVALNSGLSHHQGGEFVRMIPEIQQAIGQTPSQDHGIGLQNWADDFQAFITGDRSIYLGASVNSRLLRRIWRPPYTTRISVLCEPKDFENVLKQFPANRLILSDNLMGRVKRTKRRAFKEGMIRIYRETSRFINEMALEAQRNTLSRGGEVIQQFMYHCAPTDAAEHSQRAWSFVTCEEDMIDLILKDNNFDFQWPITD